MEHDSQPEARCDRKRKLRRNPRSPGLKCALFRLIGPSEASALQNAPAIKIGCAACSQALVSMHESALVGLLAASVAFFGSARSASAQVVFSFASGYIVHLHIIRGMAAITVILATRTTATTAMAGEATIDLGGGIGTTADIMAGGTGTGGVVSITSRFKLRSKRK